MQHLLGLDIGTSAVKAVVCDARGRIVASASAAHALSRPRAGWSEQDPEHWWRGVRRVVHQVTGGRRARSDSIAAIGLSGQMHGSVLMGAEAPAAAGRADPLRTAILWNDQRTSAQCAALDRVIGGSRRLVRLVGNAARTGFTLPKLMWVRKYQPALWRRVRHLLLPKDFVRYRLTGVLATDVGDAGGTLVFDVARRWWSKEVLGLMDLDPAIFPRVSESTEIVGRVTPWAAARTGLRTGTLVIAGSGDNQTGAVGAGVVEPGMAMAMLGTSGVVFVHTVRPRPDLSDRDHPGRLHAMCAATGTAASPRGWCNTGVMLSAAGSVTWCRDTIAPGATFEALLREAAHAPPGCDGLIFLPYLTGERCPHPDPSARAGWIGLTARHTRAHLVRSVIEGVTFGMGQILECARELGERVSSVRLSGGGNRSRLWRQIQADVYGCPVSTTSTEEGGSALGAAILAGVGAGLWPSVASACRTVVGLTETLRPSKDASARYARARESYDALYGELRRRFAALADGGIVKETTRGTR